MRYAAFLRAINVGGRVVKMSHLRAIFESLAFTGVETFIASGNVLFESSSRSTPRLERAIEQALQAALGYEVPTFVRSMREMQTIGSHPLVAATPAAGETVYVGFLRDPPPAAARKAIAALSDETNELVIAGRELYWRFQGRFSDSVLSGALFEKTLQGPTTLRNATTIRRMVGA